MGKRKAPSASKADAASPPTAPKRSAGSGAARRQTPETLAAIKLRDTYGSLTSEETDIVLGPDGRTLRQRLIHEIKEQQDNGKAVTWGSHFHNEMRAIYKVQSAEVAILTKRDSTDEADEHISPACLKAMIALKQSKPDRSKLISYLMSTESVSTAELRGILQWSLDLRLSCLIHQLPCAVKVLEFLLRLDVRSSHPEKFQAITPWINAVLLKMYTSGTQDRQQFALLRRRFLELVIPKETLDKVLGHEGGYEEITDEVLVCVHSGAVGRALWETAVVHLLGAHVGRTIDEAVTQLVTGKGEVTVAAVTEHKVNTIKAVTALPGVDLVAAKRVITIPYGETLIQGIAVASIHEEVELRTSSALKALARSHGLLEVPPLLDLCCEEGIPENWKATPAAETLESYVALTERIGTIFADSSAVATGDDVQRVLNEEANRLSLLDESAKVEIGLYGLLTGGPAMCRWVRQLRDCMPSEGTACSPEQACLKLEGLRCSQQFRLSPRPAQELLLFISGLVACLCEDRAPDLRAARKHEHAGSIIARFPFFVRVFVKSRALTGTAALMHILQTAKGKGDDACPEDVQPLVTYGWLLSDEQRTAASMLTDAVLARARNSLSQVKLGTGSKAARQPKAGASSSKTKDQATKEALAMFAAR